MGWGGWVGGADDSHGLPREVKAHAVLLQQKNAVQREIERASRDEQELQRAIERSATSAAVDDSAGEGTVRGNEEGGGEGEGKEETGGKSGLDGVVPTEVLGEGVPGTSSPQTKLSEAAAAVNTGNVNNR